MKHVDGVNVCNCGKSKKRTDRGWLRAGALALLLLVTGSVIISYIDKNPSILFKVLGVIGAFIVLSFTFYLLKGHQFRCAARQAIMLLLRVMSASVTHDV